MHTSPTPAFLFSPPYDHLTPCESFDGGGWKRIQPKGSAIVWPLEKGLSSRELEAIGRRPPGVALILILPPARTIPPHLDLLEVIEKARPHTVLPYHSPLDVEELRALLARGPSDLPVEFTDFLMWRGLRIDRETRQLIRTMISRSEELKTVNGLARSLYVSRRALGRRFMSRGLPVPSHWLQFCRVLRAGISLQSTGHSLIEIACSLGYSDGFALSNQMMRLIGERPSTVRTCLGWEWLVEAWLQREEHGGGLTARLASPGENWLTTPTRSLRSEASQE